MRDSTGRLLILDAGTSSVYWTTGSEPQLLFAIPGTVAISLAIDGSDRIFTIASEGIVRIHAADGSLIDDNFADGFGAEASLAFGAGGEFGNDLYVKSTDGALYRCDAFGTATQIGSGLDPGNGDIEFGPDGALHAAGLTNGRILRVAAICSEDVNGDDVVDVQDLLAVLVAWGTCTSCPEDINDDGIVGILDLLAVLSAWGPCR